MSHPAEACILLPVDVAMIMLNLECKCGHKVIKHVKSCGQCKVILVKRPFSWQYGNGHAVE